MLTLNELFNSAYEKVYLDSQAREAQCHYLQVIADLRHTNVEVFKKCRMLFIPNDEFLINFAGPEIVHPDYGCYQDSKHCIWLSQLIIPITNLVGEVKGFAGFNPFNYAEAKSTGDRSIAYYMYSTKGVFPKGSFLYCPEDSYTKALDDGYIFLVDGVFDAASIWDAGFNSAAMMGSTPTQQILMQLRFIKRVILIADNDEAGYKLYKSLRVKLHNVELLKQGGTKDADELLKSENREAFIKTLNDVISNSSLLKISAFE